MNPRWRVFGFAVIILVIVLYSLFMGYIIGRYITSPDSVYAVELPCDAPPRDCNQTANLTVEYAYAHNLTVNPYWLATVCLHRCPIKRCYDYLGFRFCELPSSLFPEVSRI